MRTQLHSTKDEADNIRTFYFERPENFRYAAGQYIEITLHHDKVDDRGDSRWFTLSSSPTDKLLSITTKYAGENGSSFKKKLFGLETGAEVDISEPMGDFVLPKDTSRPLIFVAGGIGLTPFHSMFEWLAHAKESRNIKFLYAVRNEDEIIFQDIFERAGVHATIVVGDPTPAWGGERGRLTAEMIIGLENPTSESLIYLSGPESMIEALEKDLEARGIPKQQIVSDFFPGYENV